MHSTHLSHMHIESYIITTFGFAIVFVYCLLTHTNMYVESFPLTLNIILTAHTYREVMNLPVNVGSWGLTTVSFNL